MTDKKGLTGEGLSESPPQRFGGTVEAWLLRPGTKCRWRDEEMVVVKVDFEWVGMRKADDPSAAVGVWNHGTRVEVLLG